MKMKQIIYHQFVEKKSRNRVVGKGKEKTNEPLGPVIQYVKSRIPDIEENIDRIFG